MKRLIFSLLLTTIVVSAEFTKESAEVLSKQAAQIRQELHLDKKILTDKEKKIEAIRKELNIPTTISLKDNEISDSLGNKKSILPEDSDSIIDTISTTLLDMKNTLLEADENPLSFSESLEIPSIFGSNKKENYTFFEDIQDTGKSFYKGFKHSGESAEFMSGVMYYNAKMYNTMFGVFDDSPFNIFEDEDENSLLDVFEKGNDLLNILD